MSQTIFTDTPKGLSNTVLPLASASKCPTNYKPAFIFAVIIIIALIFILWWWWYSQKEDLEEGIVYFLNGLIDETGDLSQDQIAALNKAIQDTAECAADKVSVSDALKLNQKYFDNINSCGVSNELFTVDEPDEVPANIRNTMRRRRR